MLPEVKHQIFSAIENGASSRPVVPKVRSSALRGTWIFVAQIYKFSEVICKDF